MAYDTLIALLFASVGGVIAVVLAATAKGWFGRSTPTAITESSPPEHHVETAVPEAPAPTPAPAVIEAPETTSTPEASTSSEPIAPAPTVEVPVTVTMTPSITEVAAPILPTSTAEAPATPKRTRRQSSRPRKPRAKAKASE